MGRAFLAQIYLSILLQTCMIVKGPIKVFSEHISNTHFFKIYWWLLQYHRYCLSTIHYPLYYTKVINKIAIRGGKCNQPCWSWSGGEKHNLRHREQAGQGVDWHVGDSKTYYVLWQRRYLVRLMLHHLYFVFNEPRLRVLQVLKECRGGSSCTRSTRYAHKAANNAQENLQDW